MDAKVERLKNKVRPLFQKYGALCDSEGFYNHYGECWIDSIQMMILFSDIIKNTVQSKLIDGIFDVENVDIKLRDELNYWFIFGNSDPPEEDIQTYFSYLVEFLKAFQLRFLRHYNAEYSRLVEVEEGSKCTYEDLQGKIALQKILETSFLERGKGREGFRSALFSQKYTTYKNRNRFRITEKKGYDPGGGSEIVSVSNILLNYFVPNRVRIQVVHKQKDFSYYFKLYFLDNLEDQIFGYYLSIGNHLTCFYTCGGHSYYFDDNQGNLPFPWKDFMTFYKDTYVNAQRDDKSLPTFYVGAKIYLYDNETNVDILKFLDIPFLEYEADDGLHLYTYVFTGKDQYKKIDFLKENGKKEYKETIQLGKNTLELKINSNYQNPEKKLNTLFELIDKASRKKKLTSKYNVQTGQFLGARLNQEMPEKMMYRAELDVFLRTLGKGSEKRIDEQLGNELTPLQTALFLRDIESVKTLLQFGADPSLYNKLRTPIQDAIVYEDADEETDPEKKKETTFQLVKLLVEAGADINKENSRKRTALWYAIESDNPKLYMYLLDNGAIVQGKNIERQTPMNLVKQRLRNTRGNTRKQENLTKLLNILKQKRVSQESFRSYVQSLRQTRRAR
jgi:hypothetical protein